jgi:cobalt-zinc-cadmium efflux system outer membrane protein
MRFVTLACACIGTLAPAGIAAQTLALTEAQVLARLSDESPRVQVVRSAVDLARADVLAAARWPNPRVSFNREGVAGVTEHMLTVGQVLPITGRIRLDVGAAAARVDAAASRADDEIRRLRADMRLAFTQLWAAQARERELTRSAARLRDLADVLARREAAGEAAGFDRLRADREVIEVDADRSIAAAEGARAQGVLVSYFAAPLDAQVVEAQRIPQPPGMIPSVEQLVARAETARPAFAALQHELEAADLAERAARRRLIPEPEVVGGTKSSDAGAGDTGSIIAVHIDVPLFDRARPERARAQARAAQVRAETTALRLTLVTQIAAWRTAVIERRAIAERYRQAVAGGADEIERIAFVSYEAGERGILELLDAHRTAAAARARQADLDAAAREAEIELEFLSGWEFP